MKQKIEKWYKQGLWSKKMVRDAVVKGIISKTDYEDVVGEKYTK